MPSRDIHVDANDKISFFFLSFPMAKSCSIICIYIKPHFIDPFLACWCIHLGSFLSWLLWKMLEWLWECRYLFKIVISSPLDKVFQSAIAGSYGSSIFNFLRNLHSGFHNGCTSLYSQWQCMRVPSPLYSHQHFLSLVFLRTAILTSVRG